MERELIARLGRFAAYTVPDEDIECPCDWDSNWSVVSFNHRHNSFQHPREFMENGRWKKGLALKMKRGLAFVLSCYEHGAISWGLQSEVHQCDWDTTQVAGLLIWEHPAEDMGAKTVPDRTQDARNFLETYNDWCNGWGYGYIVVDHGSEDEESSDYSEEGTEVSSCYGFFNSDDFGKQMAKEDMQAWYEKTPRQLALPIDTPA